MKTLLTIIAALIAYAAISTLSACTPTRAGYTVSKYREGGRWYFQVLHGGPGLEALRRGELRRALRDWNNFKYSK